MECLKHAYNIKCNDFIKDNNNNIIEIKCSYDPSTKGGWSKDGRKVKGTLHWVSCQHANNGTVNIYDRLFNISFSSLSLNFEAIGLLKIFLIAITLLQLFY